GGDGPGDVAGGGRRRTNLGGVRVLASGLPPILAGEPGAQRAHRLADRGEVVGVVGLSFGHRSGLQRRKCRCGDYCTSARPLLSAITSRSTTRAQKLTREPSRQISGRMVSPGNTGAENRPASAVIRAAS